MANVFDVAEFFIRIANQSEDDQMTNMKLNKLLYYAQGAFLARTGKPLFENQIEAWPLGPVVTDIYHKYKVCGKNPISSDEDVNHAAFTEEEFETLLDVMREYGKYTGSTLVSLSHLPGTPWRNTQEKGEKVLDPYCPRRSQYSGGTALCTVCVWNGSEGPIHSACRTFSGIPGSFRK